MATTSATSTSTSIPAKVLADLLHAGAVFEESDAGTNMIVTPLDSPAYDVYKAWVSSLPEDDSDPAVGCVVNPSLAIAVTALAPALASYGFIQVSVCTTGTSRGTGAASWE